MPEIMDSNTIELGRSANQAPRFREIDEMCTFLPAYNNERIVLALFGSDVVFPANSWRRRGIGGA